MAAVVIAFTGWWQADAVASIAIAVLILPRTYGLLRQAVDILLEATPKGVEMATVRSHILAVAGVADVHDLHAWTITSGIDVLSADVVLEPGADPPSVLDALAAACRATSTSSIRPSSSRPLMAPARGGLARRRRVEDAGMTDRLRLGVIGAGWITSIHLAALDRLDRTTLVGVASARLESAEATAGPAAPPPTTMPSGCSTNSGRTSSTWRCRRPRRSRRARPSSRAGSRSSPRSRWQPRTRPVRRGSPTAIADRGLVVAVGYHLRSLEPLPEVRARLAANPARLVTARWNDATPPPAWWRRGEVGGGQVIEQATHLYDLARLLVGEAEVVGAASLHETPATPPGADVADASAAVLRFETGAVGTFANTRRQSSRSSRSRSAPTGC